ncbi:MAG: hypothetical protein ACYDCK_00540 [Thermoplasmatota archaeon]
MASLSSESNPGLGEACVRCGLIIRDTSHVYEEGDGTWLHNKACFEEWKKDGRRRRPNVVTISDSDRIERAPDAWYRLTSTGKGESRVAVIAQPFDALRVVRTENEERLVVRTTKEISGTFEEIHRLLDRDGLFLKPGQAKEVLAHIRHDLVKRGLVESGRETFEAYSDENGALRLPENCYPRPGAHTDEYLAVRSIIDYEPTPDDWRAFAEFDSFFMPKEKMPARAACAAAPFARLLRSRRYVVAHVFHLSTNGGVGKTTVARAYSGSAWNVEMQSGEDLSSDFRFAFFLSGPGTPLVVDEAEKFDWARCGAAIKKATESDGVTVRGTRDLGMVRFPSRRILIFTANSLPPLPGPTLARLCVVRYNEERAKVDRATRQRLDAASAKLKPVGPALARAGIKRWPRLDALVAEIEATAVEIENAHGAFRDNRRARAWAVTLAFLRVWEDASGGIVKAPSVVEFVRDVVAPVEIDTFSAQMDRLDLFRAWFAAWRANQRHQDREGRPVVQGEGETWAEHVYESPTTRKRHEGHLVTNAVLQEFNEGEQRRPGSKIPALAELARLVVETYPIRKDDLTDSAGWVRLHEIGSRRQRAVFVPLSDPQVFRDEETTVRPFGGEE